MASDLEQVGVTGSAATPTQPAGSDIRVTRIRPAARWPRLDLGDLWHYRELLGIFVWRDLAVRYKQTAIGVAWAIFQPALTAIVYTVIFGRFAKFDSSGIAYPVFVMAALLPMQYFSSAVTSGAGVLVANVNLVTKVYFPRVLLPLATVLVPIVDFVIALALLAVLMVIYNEVPGGPQILLGPLFVLLAVVTAFGVVLWLAAINVRYRDVPHAIPVFLQVLPLLSGVPYAVQSLPEHWQWILAFNPMTAVVSGWRWAVLDAPAPDWPQAAVGLVVALGLLASGFAYFRASEPRFADTI